MLDPATVLLAASQAGVPITFVSAGEWDRMARGLSAKHRGWCGANGFKAQPGRSLCLPGDMGTVKHVLVGQ